MEVKTDIRACKACHLKFNDINSYVDHLESKEHVKGVMKQKYGQKYLEAKEILKEKTIKNNPNSNQGSSADEKTNSDENQENESSDEDDVYTCDVCEKICTGVISYKLHLSGNKHRKKEKQMEAMKELKEKKILPSSYRAPDMSLLDQIMPKSQFASSDIVCETCNITCTGPEVYKQHLKGEAHRKNEAKLRLKKKMEADGIPVNSSKENSANIYHCEICIKAFSGILPFQQHLQSTTHQKQERSIKKLEKVKDLYITSPINCKLQCKDCHKVFSGPTPFEEHLKSSLHDKLKKKNTLYEELEKNYPEMIKTTLVNSEEEDSDEDVIKPACGICNMIFSGPEAAHDHFISIKHKKALKRKQKIEKIKSLKKAEKLLKTTSDSKEVKINNSNKVGDSSDDDFEKISD